MTLEYTNDTTYNQSTIASELGVDDTAGLKLSEAVSYLNNTSTTGTLKAELDVDLTQLESFKYEKLSAQEVEELLLTGEDALAAAESLMAFHVSDVDSPNTDPVVGGAKQYTLTFSGGEVLVIYDNGMLGINDQKDLYQREGKEEITIPENAQWVKYAVDLFTGEKTPVS